MRQLNVCLVLYGKDKITIRYDPIFLSDKYTLEYHIKAFDKLCTLLDGYADRILVSFIDDYKNVRKNERALRFREFTESDYKTIGECMSKSAKAHNMKIFTCFEDRNLTEFGFDKGECLSCEAAYNITGKRYKKWTARREKKCNCVQMVDIGVYNSCKHFCKYCYANYDEDKVFKNFSMHNPNSSLLIGKLQDADNIKERIE